MSNSDSPKQLSLKLVMNKEKTKVLFAEANSDFVDVLLSFLTLPLGKVVSNLWSNLREEAPVIGSLNSLYTGLSNLNHTYFCTRGAKQMMLNPRSSLEAGCRKLVIDITDSPNSYFLCQDPECPYESYVNISMYSDIATCECGKSLNREIIVGEKFDSGVFTIDPLSFIVTDDLCVSPIVTGTIQALRNIGYDYEGAQGVEMQDFNFGIDEIKDLLKFALTSATPLTDMIIRKTHTLFTAKPEPGIPFCRIPKEKAHSRKIGSKLYLQKSTNKFLFAEATNEFIELLYSFLIVPLGGVEFLFGGNTCLRNIDNLYRSVSNGIGDEYFQSQESKNRLINPKIPHGYISRNQFLPLCEEAPANLYYRLKWNQQRNYNACYFYANGGTLASFKLCKDLYVMKQIKCIVTDDLTVCPGFATSLSILSGLEIPLSDVKEMELNIGLEEALSLLKASLSSKTAITDGLIKSILKISAVAQPRTLGFFQLGAQKSDAHFNYKCNDQGYRL